MDTPNRVRSESIAGAGLDVRAEEPPRQPDVLAGLQRVVLTPHVAGLTTEAQERVLETVVADIRAVLEGKPAASVANFAHPVRRR